MSLPRQVGTNTVVRVTTSMAEKLLVFAVMALFARRLGSEKLGIYTFALSCIVFLRLLTDLGINPITIRRLSKATMEERAELFGAVLSLRLLLTLGVGLLGALAFSFTRFSSLTKAGFWLAAITLTDVISDTFATVLQTELRQTWQGTVELCSRLLWAVLAVVVLLRGGGVLALLAVLGLSSVVQAAITGWCARRLLKYRFALRVDLWKEILGESWPLAFQVLMSTIYLRLDHLLVFQISGAAALGYYAVATKLAEPWGLAAGVLLAATYPLLCRFFASERERFDRIAQYVYRYLFAIAFALVVVVTLYAPDILRLVFGAEFVNSSLAFQLLMAAEVFLFANMTGQAVLVAAGLQRLTFFLSLAAAASNIVLNLLLIPRFGVAGAASASLISYAMYAVAQSAIPRTRRFAAMMWKELWRPALAGLASWLVMRFLLTTEFPAGIVLAPLLYLLILILLGGLSTRDWTMLRSTIWPEPRPAES